MYLVDSNLRRRFLRTVNLPSHQLMVRLLIPNVSSLHRDADDNVNHSILFPSLTPWKSRKFEISRPMDYRPLKIVPLLFSRFDDHAPNQGLFTLPEDLSQMPFYLDPSQSFETFYLTVRLHAIPQGTSDWRRRRVARDTERDIAEVLERVWRSWFEDLHRESASSSSSHRPTTEGDSGIDSGSKVVNRSLSPVGGTAITRVDLQISSKSKDPLTSASPSDSVPMDGWSSSSSSSTSSLEARIASAEEEYEVKWREVYLDVARVVVESEEAANRRENRAVFTFATPYGSPRLGMVRVV
jgi:hypothetical protein